MENTTPFLFDDKNEKYFLATKGRAIGPLTAEDVYERIRNAEIGLLHYIWSEGWSTWKRISDEKDFEILIPQQPSNSTIKVLQEKVTKRRAAKQAKAGQ